MVAAAGGAALPPQGAAVAALAHSLLIKPPAAYLLCPAAPGPTCSNLPEIAGFELPAGSGDWGVAAPATGAQSADLVRDLAALVESTLAELRAASGQRPVFCDIASVPGGYPVAENTEALEIL